MKIEVDAKHAIKGLDQLSKKATDLSPLMRQIAGFLADTTEDAFEKEEDPNTGGGWEGLLPGTIKQRNKKGHTGKILQDTGLLASSVVTEYGTDFAQIGTNKVYGAAHQFGVESWPNRKGSLEARPFIGFSEEDARELEGFIVEFLRK